MLSSTADVPTESVAVRAWPSMSDCMALEVATKPPTTAKDKTAEATSASTRLIPRINFAKDAFMISTSLAT